MDSKVAAPPSNIGRFRVDAVLGRGGMGSVYKAHDPTLQRTVALKTVRPDITRPDYLERLTREAQACARLRHPNVVTVYEAGEIDGLVYVVMEYLQGVDLGVALRQSHLTLESRIGILQQILDALAHTHRESVIHRDIKPSNVHVQPDGSIKVVDFGLARMAEISPLTQTGDVMATPDYASPEQLKGDRVDHRTDIYSTGALAYEMFCGRRPFRTNDDTDSVGALILRVMSAPLPPMDVRWSRQFPQIERIVARAMAKDPRERYQSAEDMRNALTAFLAASREAIAFAEAGERDRRAVIEAQTTIESTASSLPSTTATTPASQATTAAAPQSKANMSWLFAGVAAAVIVIVAPFLRTGSTTPSATAPSAASSGAPSSEAPHSPALSNQAASTDSPAAEATSRPTPAASVPAAGSAPAETPVPTTAAPAVASGREVSAKELFAARPDAGGGGVNAGLRYRLIQLVDGQQTEVDPATVVFHSGDRVRFTFDSNIDGYLYVVQQGSSGRWNVLFPGAKINGGRNTVKRAEQYDVPNGDWFKFDNTPGTEQVFVFLSRDPMDQLPGFDRPVTRPETVATSVVEDLRQRIRSRDLVFEKDGAGAEGSSQSQATYVVNRTEVGQAVAASVTLNHQ